MSFNSKHNDEHQLDSWIYHQFTGNWVIKVCMPIYYCMMFPLTIQFSHSIKCNKSLVFLTIQKMMIIQRITCFSIKYVFYFAYVLWLCLFSTNTIWLELIYSIKYIVNSSLFKLTSCQLIFIQLSLALLLFILSLLHTPLCCKNTIFEYNRRMCTTTIFI